MKTLKGYEAIEVADRYQILLYDLDSQRELSADEAREMLRRRGSATTCVIEAWPDTEEEAEQIVIKAFLRVLGETRRSTAGLGQLFPAVDVKKVIHPKAMELAAGRLVERGKLVLVHSTSDQAPIYSLPRNIYFSDEFLDKLSGVVCEECARLDILGGFHEDCLLQLIDFVKSYDFSLDDLQESEVATPPAFDQGDARANVHLTPGIGLQWLQKTANVTRSGWKTVLKPMFKHRGSDEETELRQDSGVFRNNLPPQPVPVHETSSDGLVAEERPKMTKEELIRYLQHVEILDDGELNILRMETENLRRELDHKATEISKLERQRTFMESQFGEMQRDMDTLVRAMRIARRYEPNQGQVIDATYENESEEETLLKISSEPWRNTPRDRG